MPVATEDLSKKCAFFELSNVYGRLACISWEKRKNEENGKENRRMSIHKKMEFEGKALLPVIASRFPG
ncbi:Hypothetical predicted protein [Octopus vulgaris]|uniref:Uncharacterized protein n=1 Tax=Octopus vulgaris TaxID=6645 RepID=A0AA36FBB1_OCTVU|nr:Hypothetical predicted protein [Octopus vulgaris]